VQLKAASPTWCPPPVYSSGGPDGWNTHRSVPLSHLSSSSRAVGVSSAEAPGAANTSAPVASSAAAVVVMIFLSMAGLLS
jgi:hypothetical protein